MIGLVIRYRTLVGVGALLLALVVAPAADLGVFRAEAAVPAPGPGQAIVHVYVASDRTAATTVGPLPGVTLGLFRTVPSDASIDEHTGFTSATPDLTCVSDADGDCSFRVPIGNGPGQVPQNTRLWLAKVAAPTGYYANPYWQTAPLTPSGGDPRVALRHVFQTPPLVAGQTYRSGSTWLTDPGLQTTPTSSVPSFTRRTAHGGKVALSRANPPLPEQCGLNVALVVDLSSSVSGQVGALRQAMDVFVDALRGTPSQAALYTFGTDSPANGYGPNVPLRSVATTTEAEAFKRLYAGWGNPPTNYTNWDRGLGALAAANDSSDQHVDLAVFITDGNPTVYGPIVGNNIPTGSGYTRFRELSNALASANLLKSQGTRIVALGVGDGLDAGAAYNLRTVSGRTAFDGTNILAADYLQSANYAAAGAALHDVVLSACAPSVSVIKRIVPYDGDVADAYLPPDPWEFTATPTSPDVTVTPTQGPTSLNTGGIAFDLDFEQDAAPAVTRIEEDPRTDDGYEPMPEATVCVNKSTGDDTPVTVTPAPDAPDTAFTVAVGIDDAISCVVYNRAPDLAHGSVAVHKRWRLVTATGVQDLPHGAQPVGLQAELRLDGPGGAPTSPQEWDTERAGYDVNDDSPVTISEVATLAPPACELTSITLEDGPPEASPPGSGDALDRASPTAQAPLAPGLNEWTITNEVRCDSYLTLRKEIGSGDGDPQWWTLDAIGPGGTLAGPSGRPGSDGVMHVEVTPDVSYQLAETADDEPHEVFHYVQNDLRTRPLAYPQSSGSWDCAIEDPGLQPILVEGTEGGIRVPLGSHMVCTAVNHTAFIHLVKQVQDGLASPDDFVFRAEAVSDDPHHVPHEIRASGPPGTRYSLRPDNAYRLTEVAGPAGYELVELTCTSGDTVLDPDNLVLTPGADATCVAVNRSLTDLGVQKLDAATDGPVGGASFQLVLDADGDGAYDPDVDPVVGGCTTPSNGVCTVGGIHAGTYFWVEIAPPIGYAPATPPVSDPIVVEGATAGEPAEPTTFANAQVPTDLTLVKVAAADGTPLAGAVFQLYRDDGDGVADGPDGGDTPVGGPCTTGADGRCRATGLGFGSYYWYEIAAAPGYPLPADRASPMQHVGPTSAGADPVPYLVTNPRAPGALAIEKVDDVDGARLPGAVFELYRDDGDGALGDADTLVGSCTTGPDGTCSVADLEVGDYLWVETVPPLGHDLPADPVTGPVTVLAGVVGDAEPTTVANARTPSALTVLKQATEDRSSLPGTSFELYRAVDGEPPPPGGPRPGDELVGSCTTGPDGTCTIGGLPFGDYYWVEVVPPPGYELTNDRTSALITIDATNAGRMEAAAVIADPRSTWTVTKSSDPPSGTTVRPGDLITYTLTARDLGGAASRDVVVTDDLADVLAGATLVDGSVESSAGSVVVEGTTLIWTLAELAGTETLTFQVRVTDDARDRLVNLVTAPAGNGHVPCDDPDPDCRTTEHPVEAPDGPVTPEGGGSPPEGGGAGDLAFTGDWTLRLLALGVLLAAVGALLVTAVRRRRPRFDGAPVTGG